MSKYIFENFKVTQVKQGKFQNFQKSRWRFIPENFPDQTFAYSLITPNQETLCVEVNTFQACWKLQNNGKLQNSTVSRTMSIAISRMIRIVIWNSIRVWIQKRQLQNLWNTSKNFDVLIIISPFVLLGKILLPYVILIYYWPAYYNSDEMLDRSVNAHYIIHEDSLDCIEKLATNKKVCFSFFL